MEITVLGQGFESSSKNSVGNHLIKFFADKDFHSFYGISAFMSLAGINGLSKHIVSAKNLKNITIIVGVDLKGTSEEALKVLMGLKINAYVFYQPSATIFHPKIYLFEGDKKSELIIGSSNITTSGLFLNVETSLMISIDNNSEDDRKIIESLKEYFIGLFNHDDPNLNPLTADLIDDLVKARVVPTEAERKKMQEKDKPGNKEEIQNIISKTFPKRITAQIPKEFRTSKKAIERAPKKVDSGIEASTLLWESGPLSERDLTIPKGSNTNPTGSMLFKKGRTENIDQRHYFRDNVFSSLDWVSNTRKGSTHLEKAAALFRIKVIGKDHGTFALTLTHNPKTNTRTYEENNSVTSISWGDTKPFIAREELIGRSAKLYDSANKGEFVLII